MSRTILILGAKPGAAIPDCDAVYCANAAIGFYKEEIVRIPHRVSVVNGGALKVIRASVKPEKAEVQREKREAILAAPCEERYILGNIKAEDIEIGGETSCLSKSERQRLVCRVTGLCQPIVPEGFQDEPFFTRVAVRKRLMKSFIKRLFSPEKDHPPYFRPSAGILALILAIEQNAPDDLYIVSGIGVDDRHKYPSGSHDPEHRIPKHVGADMRVLKELTKKYRVKTTEPTIAQFSGIELID